MKKIMLLSIFCFCGMGLYGAADVVSTVSSLAGCSNGDAVKLLAEAENIVALARAAGRTNQEIMEKCLEICNECKEIREKISSEKIDGHATFGDIVKYIVLSGCVVVSVAIVAAACIAIPMLDRLREDRHAEQSGRFNY